MKYVHRQAYQSDLKDQEWKYLKRFLPHPSTLGTRGRPQEWPMREIINAVLFLLRTGCQWRMLPKGFPPRSTVYGYFRRFWQLGTWTRIWMALMMAADAVCPNPQREVSVMAKPTSNNICLSSLRDPPSWAIRSRISICRCC